MSRQKYLEEAGKRVGTKARKWTLDRLIDVGGMAAVFRATHRNGNEVAIKVLHRQYADMPEAKERFLREGYVANKVKHKNAVTVLDDDELADGTPFIVMELLEGNPLEAYVQSGKKLTVAHALFVSEQVLDVLASAHDNKIIHRDIKPANIFITNEGAVKVLDYGLARVLDPGKNYSRTATGTVIGTTGYMSPEQARGKRDLIDHRTDIYAVGAVAFRLLTGRGVHTASTPMDLLLAAMTNPAPSVASVAPATPPAVAQLIDKALAFQKADRWPDCRAMQAQVRRVHSQLTGMSLAPTKPSTMPAPPPRSAERESHGHISVSMDDSGGDSIMVEFSDIDTGVAKKVQLRRRKSSKEMRAFNDDDPISEVSIVIDVEDES